MALGRQRDRQTEMLVTWSELPRSPGHVFYDRLQEILIASAFDSFLEASSIAFLPTLISIASSIRRLRSACPNRSGLWLAAHNPSIDRMAKPPPLHVE